MIARTIEFVDGGHHHDRHTSSKSFQRDRKLPIATRARSDAFEIGEAENIAQQAFNEFDRSARGSILRCSERGEQSLADPEIARDLIAHRQAFGYAVIALALSFRLMGGNARHHG